MSAPVPPPAGDRPVPDDPVAASAVLLIHRLDTATSACAGCGQPCPCPSADAAARVLASSGMWRAAPFTPFPGLAWGPAGAAARGGRRDRTARRAAVRGWGPAVGWAGGETRDGLLPGGIRRADRLRRLLRGTFGGHDRLTPGLPITWTRPRYRFGWWWW